MFEVVPLIIIAGFSHHVLLELKFICILYLSEEPINYSCTVPAYFFRDAFR